MSDGNLKLALTLALHDMASEQAKKALAEIRQAAEQSAAGTEQATRRSAAVTTAATQALSGAAQAAQQALYAPPRQDGWVNAYARQVVTASAAVQRAQAATVTASAEVQHAHAATAAASAATAPALQAQTAASQALSSATRQAAQAGELLGRTPVPQGFGEWLRQAANNSNILSRGLNASRAAIAAVAQAGRTTPQLSAVGSLWERARSAGAAGFAASAVVKTPVQEAMDYQMRLAHMANTAWAGQPLAKRQAGVSALDKAVMEGVRAGGGTRDQVAEALDLMIARNNLGNVSDAMKLLPMVTKTATAGNASANEIAALAGVAVKTGKIDIADIGKALGMALYGGQSGGFELKNMAKWLPEQMATANNVGINGLDGLAQIVALNEMAINAAGSPDQAGNNVRDFLHELGASNTANHLKRFSYDKKKNVLVENSGHTKGDNYVDLGHLLAKNQEKGIGAVDSMLGIMSMILKGDKAYQDIQRKLTDARARKDSEGQLREMERVQQILAGRGISKIFHNQQGLLGGIGAIMDPDAYHKMVADIKQRGNEQGINDNFALISGQAGFKIQQKEEEQKNALHHGLDGVNKALGTYAEKVTELYQKYPAFAQTIETTTLAMKALAAATAAASAASLLGRLGGGTAAATGIAGAASTAGLWLGGAAAAGTGGWLAGGLIGDGMNWAGKKASGNQHWTYGAAIYDFFNQEENAALAAQQVTMLPQKGQADAHAPSAGQADLKNVVRELIDAQGKAPLQVNVMLDGRQIAATVNDHNGSMMRRY